MRKARRGSAPKPEVALPGAALQVNNDNSNNYNNENKNNNSTDKDNKDNKGNNDNNDYDNDGSERKPEVSVPFKLSFIETMVFKPGQIKALS